MSTEKCQALHELKARPRRPHTLAGKHDQHESRANTHQGRDGYHPVSGVGGQTPAATVRLVCAVDHPAAGEP